VAPPRRAATADSTESTQTSRSMMAASHFMQGRGIAEHLSIPRGRGGGTTGDKAGQSHERLFAATSVSLRTLNWQPGQPLPEGGNENSPGQAERRPGKACHPGCPALEGRGEQETTVSSPVHAIALGDKELSQWCAAAPPACALGPEREARAGSVVVRDLAPGAGDQGQPGTGEIDLGAR
jgi:hypothetical protein